MPGPLSRVPGLGGYIEAGQLDQNQQMGQLQQAGALMGILSKVRAQQEEQQLRGVLSQSGGDPARAMKALVEAGTPGSLSLAAKLQGMMPKPAEPYTLSPGAQRFGPDNKLIAEAPNTASSERVQAQIEAARIRAEDQRLSRAEQNQARMEMIRLAASLRPAPQPRNLQLTTDEQGNQLIVNPDRTTQPLTTQTGEGVRKPVMADKPMTEFQGKAALYGTRAAQSDKVLKALEDKVNLYGLSAG